MEELSLYFFKYKNFYYFYPREAYKNLFDFDCMIFHATKYNAPHLFKNDPKCKSCQSFPVDTFSLASKTLIIQTPEPYKPVPKQLYRTHAEETLRLLTNCARYHPVPQPPGSSGTIEIIDSITGKWDLKKRFNLRQFVNFMSYDLYKNHPPAYAHNDKDYLLPSLAMSRFLVSVIQYSKSK